VSEGQPLVSIVTPVYNGSRYLEDLIRSVLAQDYPNIEHVIIDDGSTDGGETISILKRYPHLRWWSRPNKGQCRTVNEGFSAAQGSILTAINADDMYAGPSAIGSAVRHLISCPRHAGVFGYTIYMDETGKPLPVHPPRRLPWWALSSYLFVVQCSLLFRADILKNGQMFPDPSLRYRWDRDWILRMVHAGFRFAYLDQPIGAFRYHASQVTQSTPRAALTAEDLLIDQRFSVSPVAKRVVHTYVDAHHRLHMAAWHLRVGGVRNLIREVATWNERRRSRP